MKKDYKQAVYCYNVVKDILGDMEVIYSENILRLIGAHGLYLLYINRLIEPCGTTDNKQVFKLNELKGED